MSPTSPHVFTTDAGNGGPLQLLEQGRTARCGTVGIPAWQVWMCLLSPLLKPARRTRALKIQRPHCAILPTLSPLGPRRFYRCCGPAHVPALQPALQGAVPGLRRCQVSTSPSPLPSLAAQLSGRQLLQLCPDDPASPQVISKASGEYLSSRLSVALPSPVPPGSQPDTVPVVRDPFPELCLLRLCQPTRQDSPPLCAEVPTQRTRERRGMEGPSGAPITVLVAVQGGGEGGGGIRGQRRRGSLRKAVCWTSAPSITCIITSPNPQDPP